MFFAPPPMTGQQALTAVKTLLATQAAPCTEAWTKMSAHALTMSGTQWRVTVTLTSTAGNGTATWLVSKGKSTPNDTLATAISSGC